MAGLNKVFTYGTLRDGQEPTHRLPGYMMFVVRGNTFNFPFIQAYPWQDQQPNIFGNIMEVSDEELAQLDVYENVESGLYTREEVVVYSLESRVSKPEIVQAYIGGPVLARPIVINGTWPA